MKKLAGLFVLISGILWGSLGLLVRQFNEVGIDSMQITALRAVVTVAVMFVLLFIGKRELLKISLKDIWCFLGLGICSILFFNFCYFNAMQRLSLSVASVLLYTAPAIVMVLSHLLFKEKFTRRKLVALVLTFAGCLIVTGAIGSGTKITFAGLLFGLGAGLGYALYSIFGRYALLRHYHTLTITFYTFLFTMLGTMIFTDYSSMFRTIFADPKLIVLTLLLGVVGTVLPYITYMIGLRYIENSKAAIIACIEPVTATLIGCLFFKEPLTWTNLLGVGLVIAALIVSAQKDAKTSKKEV